MSALELTAWIAGALTLGAIAFVAAEFAVRAWLALFGRYYVWEPYARTRLELDRDTLPNLEPVTRLEINADGERGDPPPRDDPNTLRILVAGGSVAECYFLDQDSAWPQVVQRALNRPENLARLGVDRVHVGNIGRSLVTCRHIDRMLEGVLDRYARLDVVLFMVGGSDLVSWFEHKTPAVLDDATPPAAQVFAMHPEGPFGWTAKTLALRRIASYWRRRITRPIERRERAGKRLGQARAMRSRAKEILDEAPDPAPLLDHFERHLRRLVDRARAGAARVIVVRQPWFDKRFTPSEAKLLWNFGAGRPYSGEVTTYYSHALAWQLMRQIDQRAEKVARELGVEQIDLMPQLERNFDIYYDELHHTPAGCAQIGEIVAQAIVEPVRPTASASIAYAREQPHAHVTR